MVKKLDIKYSVNQSVETGEESDDVVVEEDNIQLLVPSKPKDFEVFFNLVNFSESILSKNNIQYFRDWVCIIF